jgi:RNA polymerase sigma factor (sigma-70 family)
VNHQQLIEENMNLVYSVMHKHYPTFIKDEDLVQCGYLGLVKAARKWDEEKGIFSSYAYRGIRREIQNELRKRMKYPDTLSLDYEVDGGDGNITTFGACLAGDKDVEYVALDEVIAQLTPRERGILQMFQEGMTCEEISGELGCSKETVYKVVRKFKTLMKEND